jgi:hypothetical protein
MTKGVNMTKKELEEKVQRLEQRVWELENKPQPIYVQPYPYYQRFWENVQTVPLTFSIGTTVVSASGTLGNVTTSQWNIPVTYTGGNQKTFS